MKVKYLSKKIKNISCLNLPSFHASGSITGMKQQYYGKDAFLVRQGNYIYNVTSDISIYYLAK